MIFFIIYIFLERLGRMHEKKYFILFFLFFLMKIRYLIQDLYLYSIKIQTNINQNTVKYLRKITDF